MKDLALPNSVLESPVYWFTLLELNRVRGDFATAAHAKAELERLGVRVAYRRPGRGSLSLGDRTTAGGR